MVINLLILHDSLNFGYCTLNLAVPEAWENVTSVSICSRIRRAEPSAAGGDQVSCSGQSFLDGYKIPHTLISAEGTLETAPAIGYADLICDIVSSGQTLRDNRLRLLLDGQLLSSQAVLIANAASLKNRPQALQIARTLLEFLKAILRANANLAVFANMRGTSPEAIADLIFTRCSIRGLQGRPYPA